MYNPVIGLEIHVQLNTKSKMFSREAADYFHKEANINVGPVSLGLPGALPVPNKEAFNKTLTLALALNCSINQETKFDRKHYFYPDLAKGYQISQFDKPIGENGYLEIEVGDDSRRIQIQRIHLEEDTAKSFHDVENETLIDYNKGGVPLAEIVTKPDFQSVEEVLAFAKRLRQVIRYTNVGDAEMQKGQIRYELNISVKDVDAKELPDYKVEVKNIGSISVLEKVLNFEIERQTKLLEAGEKIPNQTRGLKDMSGETIFQRSKESSNDYRYFPEPDIPPIIISDEWISQIKESMPELPVERKHRYIDLGLEPGQADIFVEDTDRGEFFERALDTMQQKDKSIVQELAKWINTDIAGLLIKDNKDFKDCTIKVEDLIYIVNLISTNKLTRTTAKSVLEEVYKSEKSAEQVIAEKGLLETVDESQIDDFIQQVIKENEKVVSDIQKNPNAIKFLVGQVMRLSKGRANAVEIEKRISEKISSSN